MDNELRFQRRCRSACPFLIEQWAVKGLFISHVPNEAHAEVDLIIR